MSRFLVVHSLSFNRKRKVDEAVAPSNLDGVHLFVYMEKALANCTYSQTRDSFRKTMLEQQAFKRINENACLMHLSIARWGEESQVLNPDNYSEVKFTIDRESPISTTSRAYCFVPSNGEKAYFFSEYVDRLSAGVGFVHYFKKDFVRSAPSVTLKLNRLYGAEEWLRTASLSELRINVKRKAPDNSDLTSTYSGTLEYALKPDKKTIWGKKTLSRILGKDENERRATLIEIADDFGFTLGDLDSVDGKMTLLGQDGKKTTLPLSCDPRAPYLYLPISGPDGLELSDQAFIDRCNELVHDYSERH